MTQGKQHGRDGGTGPGRRTLLAGAALGAAGLVAAGAGTAAAVPAAGAAAGTERGAGRGGNRLPVPAVVAHRGASGYRPEHTLGAYRLGLDMGADIIEQDLVPTKDGHLVCRHENEIGGTTDVADHPEFASRRTTKSIDGTELTGWFTEDFTLAELKTLRAVERIPDVRQRNTLYNGRWEVPTFEEVLQWAEAEGRRRGKAVWLHVETKHPTYFRKLDLGLEEPLAKLLRRYGRHRANSPVFLQSFEPGSMQRMNELVDTPTVVLLSGANSRPWDFVEAGDPRTVADLITPGGLEWIAGFADGIGPTASLVVPTTGGRIGAPTALVGDAHAAGLVVHPYTHRNENAFLPASLRRGTDPAAYGDAFALLEAYFEAGVDGLFSDNPDTAVLARDAFLGR
ncbi:glycerophosphodiester phosphodiesterase [Streptomyces thermolineatus]|uniref:glycerophosphodiester phosphodiesterase n=1 Tax=Streptomyces thermolineatus TaxID=44033 RepID=A0ABP5YHS8_9ACTN